MTSGFNFEEWSEKIKKDPSFSKVYGAAETVKFEIQMSRFQAFKKAGLVDKLNAGLSDDDKAEMKRSYDIICRQYQTGMHPIFARRFWRESSGQSKKPTKKRKIGNEGPTDALVDAPIIGNANGNGDVDDEAAVDAIARQGIIGLSTWAPGVGEVIDCYTYACKLKYAVNGYKCGDIFMVYTIGGAKYLAKIFNRGTGLSQFLLVTVASRIVVETVAGRHPIRLNFNVPGLFNHYVKVNSMLTMVPEEAKLMFKDANFFNATTSLVESIKKFKSPIVYREATVLVDDLPSEDLKGHKWGNWVYDCRRNHLFENKDWVAPPIAHPVNFLDMDDSRVSSNSSASSSPSGSGASSRSQVPNRAPPGSSTPLRQQGSSKDIHSFADPSSQLEPNASPSAGAANLSYESNSSASQAQPRLGGPAFQRESTPIGQRAGNVPNELMDQSNSN